MTAYLEDYFDYPVTSSKEDMPHLLTDDFSKAVILEHSGLDFDARKILDDPNFQWHDKYWIDQTKPRGRKTPGEVTYTLDSAYSENNLTVQSVADEISGAGLVVEREDIEALHQKMTLAMQLFSDVVRETLQRDDFYMRGWQLWAPKNAQGRTPELHIDRTHLTGLWYAGRAPFKVYVSEIPQKVWQALNPVRNNHHQENPVIQEFTRNSKAEDYIDGVAGKLIVTRNSKTENLLDPNAQRIVCVHKSGDIQSHGQAGMVMVPKFVDKLEV